MSAVILFFGLYLVALSNRYSIIDNDYVLDKWTGIVTAEGHFVYKIK